jgi:hypothetical protein
MVGRSRMLESQIERYLLHRVTERALSPSTTNQT